MYVIREIWEVILYFEHISYVIFVLELVFNWYL